MTRSELIDALAARFPQLTELDAGVAVKELVDAIAQELIKGRRIEIRGFGSFSLNYRRPRTGRNPKTGEKVDRSYARHVIYLAFLAPDIVQRILDGDHPMAWNATRLLRMTPQSTDWVEQCRQLGLPA